MGVRVRNRTIAAAAAAGGGAGGGDSIFVRIPLDMDGVFPKGTIEKIRHGVGMQQLFQNDRVILIVAIIG